MRKILEAYISLVNAINVLIGKSVAWLTTALVLLICYDVLLRYLFKATTVAIIELEWHLFALIFLWAAAYTLKEDRHVRVDVFYNKFSEKQKAWVNLVGGLLFLIPFCVVVMYTSYSFALRSFAVREGSPNPGGLPALYLIKGSIVLGFLFLLMQTLAMIFASWLVILGQRAQIFDLPVQEGGENHA